MPKFKTSQVFHSETPRDQTVEEWYDWINQALTKEERHKRKLIAYPFLYTSSARWQVGIVM